MITNLVLRDQQHLLDILDWPEPLPEAGQHPEVDELHLGELGRVGELGEAHTHGPLLQPEPLQLAQLRHRLEEAGRGRGAVAQLQQLQ